MKTTKLVGAGLLALLFALLQTLGTLAAPEGDDPSPVIVTISEIHLCCGACVKAVEKAARIDGVQAEVSQDEGTAVLTGATYADIQKSLDEIAKAGFSGKIEDDTASGQSEIPRDQDRRTARSRSSRCRTSTTAAAAARTRSSKRSRASTA